MGMPLESGRPRLVLSTPGIPRNNASVWPPRLWLCTEGNSFPGYGRLLNVPLTSTSIFGTVYEASPLMFVFHPDSRWQNCCGHWPTPPRNVSRNAASAAPRTEDVVLRVLRDHAARVLDDVAGAGAALDRDGAQTRVHGHVDTVEAVKGAADLVGERKPVPDLLDLPRLHVAEGQRIAAAARQPGIARHVVDERVEVGGRPRIVDGGRQVSPAPPDVVNLERYSRRDLLRDASRQIPAVLPRVPSVHERGVNRVRGEWLPKEWIPEAALAVGRRVQEVAIGDVVSTARITDWIREVVPASLIRALETRDPGGAEVRPLVHGVERRHVPAHEELERRLAVAEHVVGRAEPRHQVLLIERAVLGREYHGGRQEAVRAHSLLGEVIAQMLEAERALQRETIDRPAILRIERIHGLLLFLLRCVLGVRVHLRGNAVREGVLEQSVVVEVRREGRHVVVVADTDLHRVRPGNVRDGPLEDVRQSSVLGPRPRAETDRRTVIDIWIGAARSPAPESSSCRTDSSDGCPTRSRARTARWPRAAGDWCTATSSSIASACSGGFRSSPSPRAR